MAEISQGAFMSRAHLRRLERLQQQLETARRYQPPIALPLPFPEFAEWATALSAELYAAAGMHRDNARLHPLELDLRGLHDVFTNARWYFVRNHGREPSDEEWLSIILHFSACRRGPRPSPRPKEIPPWVTTLYSTRSRHLPHP